MKRVIFEQEHSDFRAMVRAFLEKEVVPEFPEWEERAEIPRAFWRRLGDLGIIGMRIPEKFGGGGVESYKFGAILTEEVARAVVSTGALRCHMDVAMPYLLECSNEEQQKRWFPGLASGNLFTALGLTEPGGGTDLSAVRTTAVRDGDHYVLNGAKTFITGGIAADLVVVLARTDASVDHPRRGLSLLVVEASAPGFVKGRNLKKMGLRVQDTAELFFEDVRVPVTNLLGVEGEGFRHVTHNLALERLGIAVASVAAARSALTLAKQYVADRKVRGERVLDFQNTRFELATVDTELHAAQAFVDAGIQAYDDGDLTPVDAARIKLFCTEFQARAVDRCLQLFGGYGYMAEYPISRLYTDARVSRIYGGTSEVMKAIVGSSIARSFDAGDSTI